MALTYKKIYSSTDDFTTCTLKYTHLAQVPIFQLIKVNDKYIFGDGIGHIYWSTNLISWNDLGNQFGQDSINCLLSGTSFATLVAPTNLTSTNINYFSFTLNWVNHSGVNCSGNTIQYQNNNGIWIDYKNVGGTVTTTNITGLTPSTTYNYRVLAKGIGQSIASSDLTITTKTYLIEFCSNYTNYTTIDTTCGSSNGHININNLDYFIFYTFLLQDYLGHTYTINAGTGISNVPAGYYRLTATPKSQYRYFYGYSPCIIDFIPIYATNTTISNVNPFIRQQTSSYLIASGATNRLIITFDDSNAGHSYDYYLLSETGNVEFSANTSNVLGFIINPIIYGFHYAIIKNTNNNCVNLLDKILIQRPTQNWFNLSGIKQIFISPYNNSSNFTWDNWSTKDEDYYVQGVDSLTFQGTKIKRFYNTNPWFKITTNADTTYTCPFEKVRQGFMYTNTLTLDFAPTDYNSWYDLINVLNYTQRYLIVFQDNNLQWWTFGYQNVGARVYNYTHDSTINQYQIVFKYFGFNILTALDEEYVNNFILK